MRADFSEQQARRDFLRAMTTAAATTLAAGAPRALARAENADTVQPIPTADSFILLWMRGGKAAPDTRDPNHYQP
ncbi:MAG: hypothetical protein ACK6D4_01530, partial [Planctomyces sp.]